MISKLILTRLMFYGYIIPLPIGPPIII